MSKELEALQEIKEKFFVKDGSCTVGDFGLYRRLDIIETALKNKEQVDMLLEQFGLSNIQNFIDNLKIVAREQKKLKALEIIKEHWTYNDKGLVQIKPISMESADLLKEVLL